MCPVFARTTWRYPQSRAYRTVLIDAGHLGQTFCLVATALGLAPFTTMAFSEARLEELLGLDGVTECPIYIAGVGMPDPAGGGAPGKTDLAF
jgi:SagB-type dehydrogenase family enzyme